MAEYNNNNPSPKNLPVDLTESEMRTLIKGRNVAFLGIGLAIASIFIGGTLLCSIAMILAIYGNYKLNTVSKAHADNRKFVYALKWVRYGSLIVCGVLLIVNVVTFMYLYPKIQELLGSGDYDRIAEYLNTGRIPSGTSSASGSSTW